MNRWVGVLGLILIAAGIFLIRFPGQDEQGLVYTGLLVSERVVEYPIMVEIVPPDNNSMGIVLHYDELDFGILSRGMTARKNITMEGPGSPVKVRVWSEGNISSMVSFSKHDFTLEGPDSLEVVVNASEAGSYGGTVYISSRSTNYRWLRWMDSWV